MSSPHCSACILVTEDDVVQHGEALHQLEVLVNHADAQSIGVVGVVDFDLHAVLFDHALFGLIKAEQNAHQRGFSGAVFTQQGVYLALFQLERNDDEYSVVAGLDMGADDYISKPFRPRELLSRINSVLRRTKNTQNIISYHDLVVDTNQATVVKNGTEILLSAMEYKLLLVFLRNKGIVLSRRRLLELLWDTTGEFINDNTLTVYMKRLRDKIETNPQEPEIIITVRGLGYKVG